MEKSRTQNAMINMLASMGLKLLQMILPFISRSLVIRIFGIEYVGLSGLFTAIIGVLNLAELGVGSAMIFALYQPVQEKDGLKICRILKFYKKAYLMVGGVILAGGLILTPFLRYFIREGTYPAEINIYALYYIYLANTVITYLVFAYKASLLDAHQMGYKGARVKMKMLLAQYAAQIIMLLFVNNYYLYAAAAPVCTVINCVLVGRIADREFPSYKPEGVLEYEERKEIINNVKALFLYKIGTVVLNSLDSIIISWYFGARVLGIYNNYYYIISALFSFITAVCAAVVPSVGNSVATESRQKNYRDFMMFSFCFNWLIGWCAVCLVCLLQPFIALWIGETNLLSFGSAVLFAVYFYAFRVGDIAGWYKDTAGLWRQDWYRPAISSAVNLALNLILIRYIGLYGILLSTIAALLIINYPISVRIVLRYFGQSGREYRGQQTAFLLTTVINTVLTYQICGLISPDNSRTAFPARLLLCIFVPNLFYYVVFRRHGELKRSLEFIKRKVMRWR